MDTLSCILERRSIRNFKSEKIPAEIIEKIIDHARFSPSWANTKTARYICISNDDLKRKISMCCYGYNDVIVEHASDVIVLTGVTGRCGIGSRNHTPSEWLMFDSGLAAQTFCLAAWDLGVGSIILGAFDANAIAQLIPIPENEEIMALIAIGYPSEIPSAPRRKKTYEILRIL